MIEVKNLTKKFGDHYAIRDLTFNVSPGKIYGLLGPNGAGKSTTMNIMTGYIGATSGKVLVNGHDIVTEAREAKKCIGYLPEIPPLYNDMTVREYLNFAAELKQVPKAIRKSSVSRVMEQTKITDMAGRLCRNLSKGYRQRVGMACAIIGDPEIIILDEPTVGLDPIQIADVRDLIRDLGKTHTVILSSHILSEVSEVCDHVFIISNGEMVLSEDSANLAYHLKTGQTLEIIAKGSSEDAKKALSELPNVDHVTCTAGDEEDTIRLTVSAAGKSDIRSEVSLALSSAKCPVLSMNETGQSLEDVFMAMTSEADESRK